MEKPDFTVSKMTEDDVLAAKELIAQSYFDTYINEEHDVTEEWVSSFKKEFLSDERIKGTKDRLKKSNYASWVVKDMYNKIVGAAIQYIGEDKTQNLLALYVDKDYHGIGAAQALMSSVLEWFDKKKPIILGVATYNERAKAFYRKWGFEEIIGSDIMYLDKIPEIKMIRKGDK